MIAGKLGVSPLLPSFLPLLSHSHFCHSDADICCVGVARLRVLPSPATFARPCARRAAYFRGNIPKSEVTSSSSSLARSRRFSVASCSTSTCVMSRNGRRRRLCRAVERTWDSGSDLDARKLSEVLVRNPVVELPDMMSVIPHCPHLDLIYTIRFKKPASLRSLFHGQPPPSDADIISGSFLASQEGIGRKEKCPDTATRRRCCVCGRCKDL